LRICKLLCAFLLFCSFLPEAFGQVSSPKNRFEVDVIKGCAPLTITATNTFVASPMPPIAWNFDWNGDQGSVEVDPDASPQTAEYTYTEPGSYLVLQVLGNQQDVIDTLRIEVMEPLEPRFNVYNCINNSVYIDFSEEFYYEQFYIEFGDGNTQSVSTSQGFLTYQYASEGAYTISAEGRFTNAAFNCAQSDTTIITILDLDIANISQVEVVGEQEIQLAYNLANPNVAYRLEVDENGRGTYDLDAVELDHSSSTYNWTNANISTSENYYCFRIVAVNRCDESLNQESNVVCSIGLEVTPAHLQNELSWYSSGYSTYRLLKDNSLLSEQSSTNYTDIEVNCQQSYSYQISAESNGVISLSNQLQVAAISTEVPEGPAGLSISLQSASASLNWAAVAEAEQYYIYRSVDDDEAVLYDSVSTLNYTDPRELAVETTYCYQLSYRDLCGVESELSEEACVLIPRQARVFLPNAFSPNGDGLNDEFVYKADLLESVRFQVFNRWGELIFSTQTVGKGWDGTYQNAAAPQGTYLFVLEVVDQLGNSFSKSGKFTLISGRP